jgi:N-acetylglucosaminyldiphosphoundecaprenol N-acetyl-beta-D-mannosaminyltransferase
MHEAGAVCLLGVRIHALELDPLLEFIVRTVRNANKIKIMYVNVHALNLAYRNPNFRKLLNCSDVTFCDGYGVKWAADFIGERIPQRFTPPDWISLLCQECVNNGFSVFLLGARPGVAEEAATRLLAEYPDLKIAGTHHGYFNKFADSNENKEVLGIIDSARPDILIVGFGMPLQEQWVEENFQDISANVILTAGALLDTLSGEIKRAPKWMTDHGLEWFGRLIYEPRRLWRRYLIGNPIFIWRIVKQRLGILHLER